MVTENLSRKRIVGMFASAIVAVSASAVQVEMTKSFTYGYNFTSGDCWEGGIAPQPGYDFHVGNGFQMQVGIGGTGRDINFNFPGDSLIFGTVGGDSGVFCHAGAGNITINNLTLANGYYYSYYAWSYSGAATLRGSAIITSPESAPFEFRSYSSSANYKGLDCYMAISGDVGTGFAVTDDNTAYKGVMSLFASSPSYLGSIKVKGGMTLGIAASDSLGGKLASFDEDSLLLEKQATLRSLEAGISLAASDNRGMRVASTGGRVLVESGKDMTIGWPISGDGTLVKAGAGTLYISNTVTVAAISLQEGNLAAAPGTTVETPRLALAGGGIGAGVNCGILSATSLELADGAKIPVQIVGDAEVGRVVPFFKASAGRYTIDDFQTAAGTGTYGEPFTRITSAIDGADDIFSFQVFPLVTTSGSGDSGYYSAQNGPDWSDGNPVHGNAAYLVLAETGHKFLRTFDYGSATDEEFNYYEFPGHSITLAGASASAMGRIAIRSRTFNGWLRFMDYSNMTFDDIPDPDIYRITGRIDINANPSTHEGVTWNSRIGATSIVESVISGTGFIYLNNPASANTTGTFVLAGTNTYVGIISVYGGAKYVCLRIHDERNLGANPPTFDATRLRLDAGTIFHPIGSVMLDDPNRGIRFNGAPIIMRVDDGETLAFGSPISISGSTVVTKAGGGTLDFSCPLDIASTFAIKVEGGFVKCGDARKLASAAISFGEGCGLAMDRVTDASDERYMYGMVLTNAATTFPAAKLKVRIDHGGKMPRSSESVPFLTVPATLAASLGDRIEFVKNTPYGDWRHVRDEVTLDGAQAVRYSAKFLNGLKVMIR